MNIKTAILTTSLLTTLGLSAAHAAVVTWTGPSSGNWNTGSNWDLGVPNNNDTVNIGSGNTVTYDTSDFFISGATINLDGTLTRGGVFRTSGSTFNVGSTGALAGGFWDLGNSAFTFEDGASVTTSNFELKNSNTFSFNLSATGFVALTPGTLRHAGGTTWADATINVDLGAYSPAGFNDVITLINAGNNFDSGNFSDATVNFLNRSDIGSANLIWDDTNSQLQLLVTKNVPEPTTVGLLVTGFALLSARRKHWLHS